MIRSSTTGSFVSSSATKPNTRQRLTVEQLEEKITPAIAFAVGGADGGVRALSDTGSLVSFVTPFANYSGLVSVAMGDFSGDGVPDLLTAPANPSGVKGLSPAEAGKVYVFDGDLLSKGTLSLINTFTPFTTTSGPGGDTGAYINGLNIAAGDVNGDGKVDLIAGTRGGSATEGLAEYGRLVVLDGAAANGTIIGGIQTPFGEFYQKGVVVTAGNLDGVVGDEIAVTRGGPVVNPDPAIQKIKLKVLKLQGSTLTQLPLAADGETAFAPFGDLAGPANAIKRDGRVTFVDTNGDGKNEVVFSALDPLTDTTNTRVRVGVYSISTVAATGAATIVSTGADAGTYLTGTAIVDHAITHVAATGTQENLVLIKQSTPSAVVYLAPLTGVTQAGGFSLNIVTGGITIDGV